jgi:hypothetical protein
VSVNTADKSNISLSRLKPASGAFPFDRIGSDMGGAAQEKDGNETGPDA